MSVLALMWVKGIFSGTGTFGMLPAFISHFVIEVGSDWDTKFVNLLFKFSQCLYADTLTGLLDYSNCNMLSVLFVPDVCINLLYIQGTLKRSMCIVISLSHNAKVS